MPRRNMRRQGLTLENAAELIEEGMRRYEGGDKQGAEQKLRAACAIGPSVPQTHYNLGYFYSLEERWHDAEQALRKAIEHQPDYPRALFALAGVYMELGRLDRAQEYFLTTERLTPDDLDIQLNLGVLAARVGRPRRSTGPSGPLHPGRTQNRHRTLPPRHCSAGYGASGRGAGALPHTGSRKEPALAAADPQCDCDAAEGPVSTRPVKACRDARTLAHSWSVRAAWIPAKAGIH